jgi:hypothetical protein
MFLQLTLDPESNLRIENCNPNGDAKSALLQVLVGLAGAGALYFILPRRTKRATTLAHSPSLL